MLGLSDTGKAAADEFVAAAPDLIAKLQTAGMTVEAGLISGVHSVLTDGISQATSVVQADLAPLIEESKHWRSVLSSGIQGNIGGMPFSAKFMLSGDPSIADPHADPANANPAVTT